MSTDTTLIEVANFSFVDSFRKLTGHVAGGAVREEGGVFAFSTGLPLSLFNSCIVLEPVTPEDLGASLDWVEGRGVPHRLWIAEGCAAPLVQVAAARGLETVEARYPGMTLHPVRPAPHPAAGVSVTAVESGEDLQGNLAVLAQSGLGHDLARRLYPPALAADPDVRLFTARLDGRPVGYSVAIRSGSVAGVYGVGTLKEARRRGVGAAASWAAVEAGRAWGCDPVVLQASPMGYPIYAAMGFRTVVEYVEFRRPAVRS